MSLSFCLCLPAGTNPVTLECGKSSDPDGELGGLTFEWSCAGPHPAGCFTGDGSPLIFAANASTQQFTLQASPKGLSYNVTCRASKGARSGSDTGFLTVVSLPLPTVFVEGLAEPFVNPAQRLVLRGSVTTLAQSTLDTRWVQTEGPPLDLSDPVVRRL